MIQKFKPPDKVASLHEVGIKLADTGSPLKAFLMASSTAISASHIETVLLFPCAPKNAMSRLALSCSLQVALKRSTPRLQKLDQFFQRASALSGVGQPDCSVSLLAKNVDGIAGLKTFCLHSDPRSCRLQRQNGDRVDSQSAVA